MTLTPARAPGEVGIAVADTGSGIAPEHLPYIFDRLYRVQPGRDRGAGGSGLGLSIVRRLAALLGGRVSVDSAVGVGSTFTLWLPARAVAPPAPIQGRLGARVGRDRRGARVTQRRFLLSEDAIPDPLVQPRRRPARAAAAGAAPGHRPADSARPTWRRSSRWRSSCRRSPSERWIEIPDAVRDIYRLWRPTPLYRAHRLEGARHRRPTSSTSTRASARPAATSPTPPSPQAYYNKQEGVKRLATETGAGQWGSALAFACAIFGLECKVYMVKVSYDQKPYRRSDGVLGREVVASPSRETQRRPRVLEEDPDSHRQPRHRHLRGGRGRRHPRRHQVLARLRAQPRPACTRRSSARRPRSRWRWPAPTPTSSIGCVGGGCNFAGLTFPFVGDKIGGQARSAIVAVEPPACPTLTTRRLRLRLRRHGQDDAAGQDAHARPRASCRPASTPAACATTAMAPLSATSCEQGLIEAVRLPADAGLRGGRHLRPHRGDHPGPGSAHAIRAPIDEALRAAKQARRTHDPLQPLRPRQLRPGRLRRYLAGDLVDYELPQAEIDAAAAELAGLPTIPG